MHTFQRTMTMLLCGTLAAAGAFAVNIETIAQDDDPSATPAVGRRGAVVTVEPITATPEPTERAESKGGEVSDEPCELAWFFDGAQPVSCPAGEAVAGEATFQRFQYGYMIWTQPDDQIYVMHVSAGSPMWLQTDDPFTAGMPERDDSWDEPQPPQSVQPRFGFGALWRADDTLRERIGWAIQQWEFVYEGRVQVAVDGTIYLEDPNGSVFELSSDGASWQLFR
ncbi:MAG: hypothetical protein AAF125_13810 [Chloroflexota bacterium]